MYGKIDATHRVVYITQSRIEEWVRVDPKTGIVIDAGPMLRLFAKQKLTLDDIRTRKMVTKIEPIAPPEPSKLILTDL